MALKQSLYRGLVSGLITVGRAFSARTLNEGELGYDYKVEEDITYTPSDWSEPVKGDLFIPEGVEKAPVVLLIHGGGWAENDNRYQMKGIAKDLVRRGYCVFNVTYRLAPEYHFPAPVDDLYEAIKWLAINQSRLNIDTCNLALFGYSAGGHLAELVAIGASKALAQANVSIKAVVAGGTPHFMRLDPDFYMVRDFIGISYSEDPEPFHKATPVDQVEADFPALLVYHGAQDKLVPSIHVKKWKDKLDELSVDYELYWVKGRGHIGTFLFPEKSISKAIDFLDRKLG